MTTSLRIWLLACWLAAAATTAPAVDPPPSPPEFSGFGLADFEGEGSIAAALRRAGDGRREPEPRGWMPPGVELRGVTVRGPDSRDTQSPIAAEVHSRIDRFDVTAGVRAPQDAIVEGPAQWIGRVGLGNDRPEGGERIELRTTLDGRAAGGMLGLEVGPRLERRLRRGATFFIDGKAEARAARAADTGWWAMPGGDGGGAVGVAARTGLVR